MDLYQEILISALSKEKMRIIFPDLEINAKEIIETESYKALPKNKRNYPRQQP